MANREFLAVVNKYDTEIAISEEFYETYAEELELPKEVTLEDKLGHNFTGEMYVNKRGNCYLVTDTKKIVYTYSYKRFAVVKMTYKLKGRFELFVPNNTKYWMKHDSDDLLPYAGRWLHPSEYDFAGNYKPPKRGAPKVTYTRPELHYELYGPDDSGSLTEYSSPESSTQVNIFTGRPFGWMTPSDSDESVQN